MLRALSSAATGMEAQELRMDILANNLANVNTTGFKKSRGEFQDLLYENIKSAGATAADGTQVPVGLQVGQGVKPVATLRNFTTGDLRRTGNSLDVAIEGAGFFQVVQSNGQPAFSRDGSFKTDSKGRLVNANGMVMDPQLSFPEDTKDISITPDGKVSVTKPGSAEPVEVGRLQLATFANPAGLEAIGDNLYLPTAASGTAVVGVPGEEGLGMVAQGFLEGSNVKVIEEMIDMIMTQRAYETNSRVIKAADDMLQSTANLR